MGASGRPFQLSGMQSFEQHKCESRRTMSSREKNRVAGFTVLELVATIVIVGVLAATAAPTFFDNQPYVARGYADELVSTLRFARRVAVASECRVAVSINAGGYTVNQHATYGGCDTGTNWNTPVRRADGRPLSGATPGDVTVTPNVLVVFNPDGSIAGAPSPVAIGSFTLTWETSTGTFKVWP